MPITTLVDTLLPAGSVSTRSTTIDGVERASRRPSLCGPSGSPIDRAHVERDHLAGGHLDRIRIDEVARDAARRARWQSTIASSSVGLNSTYCSVMPEPFWPSANHSCSDGAGAPSVTRVAEPTAAEVLLGAADDQPAAGGDRP